jgi:prevent-host-death family protein
MTITTLSSREFNQDASRAKKATKDGPVFITDRGRPAHVLLSIEEYRRLTGATAKIADLLALPGVEDIEFEVPRLTSTDVPSRHERRLGIAKDLIWKERSELVSLGRQRRCGRPRMSRSKWRDDSERRCHARESGHPDLAAVPGLWIPAFAGMTKRYRTSF